MVKDYKKITTKNGNKYVGWFLENGDFKTTFDWTIDSEDIKEIK